MASGNPRGQQLRGRIFFAAAPTCGWARINGARAASRSAPGQVAAEKAARVFPNKARPLFALSGKA